MEEIIMDQQEQDQEAMNLRLQAYVKQLAKKKQDEAKEQDEE